MSEDFKVGDRVIARSRRDLGEGVIEAIEPRYVMRSTSGATYTGWAESFELVPPEPPSLLEAAEVALATFRTGEAGAFIDRMTDLRYAIDREKAKP